MYGPRKMNLVLLFPEDFVDTTHVRLTDYRAKHIREIHRAPVGKVLKVGLVNGGTGDGTVTSVEKGTVELAVRIRQVRPETSNISLVLALPRPQTLKKVLETIGAFGVKRLALIDTDRVQKSFFSSKLLKNAAWLKHLRLGMEQGGRTHLPELVVEPSLTVFFQKIETLLPNTARLIAHPGDHGSIWETPVAKSAASEIVCAIGPEGGWLDHEVQEFLDHGFFKIRLGETVHRVENAVTAFLAQIELIRLRRPPPVSSECSSGGDENGGLSAGGGSRS